MESRQRKTLIYSLAAVILLIGIYQWGVVPALEYKQDLLKKQEATKTRIKELNALQDKYEAARQNSGGKADFGSRAADFTLFSYLESRGTKDGLKQNIEYMRPSSQSLSDGLREKMVQMRLKDISLKNLVRFLANVEQARQGIYVKRISIRSPRNNPGTLTVDLMFSAFEAAG